MCSRAAALAISLTLVACHPRHPGTWGMDAADPEALRATTSGPVVGGVDRAGGHAWLGIPFAAPPVGARRFRAPAAPAPWSSPRPALEQPPGCTQLARGGFTGEAGDHGQPADEPEVTGQEDCLYLNVYAPRWTKADVPRGAARRPVMLWIHGGGNSIGTASAEDASWLAVREDVVVVAAQYRLGPFGWLRHAALRADAADAAEASGNFGTLDQLRALAWVRDNAAAFGGDPGNVTIFGESAGGVDVYALLVSPLAKGLFARAIVESGGLSLTTADEAERFADDTPPGHRHSASELAARLLIATGRAHDRADARARLAAMAPADVAALLRGVDAKALLLAYADGTIGPMLDMPTVFHDGVVLPAGDFLAALGTPGGWNQVPVIVGTNRDEMKSFQVLSKDWVKKVGLMSIGPIDPPLYEAAAEWSSRAWKWAAVDVPAAAMTASGAAVFAYRFDWRGEGSFARTDLRVLVGAGHAIELGFVFGHSELGWLGRRIFEGDQDAHEALSNAIMDYWGAFAHAGAPGRGARGDLPPWPAWGAGPGPVFQLLDTPAGGGIRPSGAIEDRAAILDGIEHDPRLHDQRDRCRVYHQLALTRHVLDRDGYLHAGAAGCAAYPLEAFPWNDAPAK